MNRKHEKLNIFALCCKRACGAVVSGWMAKTANGKTSRALLSQFHWHRMVDCDSPMHARQAFPIKTPSFISFLSEFGEFLVHKFLSNQKRSLTAINLRGAMFSHSDDMRQPSASLTSGENKSVKHEIENRGKLESKLKANRRKKCKKKKLSPMFWTVADISFRGYIFCNFPSRVHPSVMSVLTFWQLLHFLVLDPRIWG